MDISVVGTGYVGLVAGVCFADMGHRVTCIDNNTQKITDLKEGKIPIYEPGLEDLMRSAQSRLSFSTNLADGVNDTKVVFVAVGTPEKADGHADLGPTFSVIKEISQAACAPLYIVLKSTVPVGTHKEVEQIISKYSEHAHQVVNNPEFLKEGAAIDDFLRPDRVVIGCRTHEAREVMAEIYRPFLQDGQPILFMSNGAAELSKYASNSFLSVKISFANELARLADAVGADYNEVRQGFTSDSRICESFFYPGVGYGGSCFPKDVQALIQTAKKFGTSMDIVEAADQVNDRQKTYLYDLMKKEMGSLEGKTIAMWGLAFKPRTDDVREAPARYLIEKLTQDGAKVVAYDPVASEAAQKAFPFDFEIAPSALQACQGADALMIVTEWNEFQNPNFSAMKEALNTPSIFDGRNALNCSEVKKYGFNYFPVGRQAVAASDGLN